LKKKGLLDSLDRLEESTGEYLTIYVKPDSFPNYVLAVTEHGFSSQELKEALDSEDLLKKTESYGTGAAIFWSQSDTKYIIVPPFPIGENTTVRGRPETSQLRKLLKRDRMLGVILVNWGSYVIAVLRSDELLECKTGTGHIHKKHRKGGSSQKRFARRTEEQKREFLNRVVSRIDEKLSDHHLEEIFMGGNRLITGPLLQECLYLKPRTGLISRRFLSARYADRQTLAECVERIYSSALFIE